jgi:hypothetical protein
MSDAAVAAEVERNHNAKNNGKVIGRGQECPPHTACWWLD